MRQVRNNNERVWAGSKCVWCVLGSANGDGERTEFSLFHMFYRNTECRTNAWTVEFNCSQIRDTRGRHPILSLAFNGFLSAEDCQHKIYITNGQILQVAGNAVQVECNFSVHYTIRENACLLRIILRGAEWVRAPFPFGWSESKSFLHKSIRII